MLSRLSGKVLYVYPADNFDGGCYNYRQVLPYSALARFFGCKVKIQTNIDPSDLNMADIIVFNRQYNEACLKFMSDALDRKKLVVFDLDDQTFELDNDNPSHKTYCQPKVRQNMAMFIQHSHVFTVATSRLAEELKKYRGDKPIDVIENSIPWNFFRTRANNNLKPVVSYHGGASHISDINVIKHLQNETKKYLFTSFGNIKIEGWHYSPPVPFRHFYDVLTLLDPDVGLMPLKPNIFNYCRSFVKFIENTSVGAVCVGSNYGPYSELKDCIVYPKDESNPNSWLEAIAEALDRKKELIQNSEMLVRERFNIRKTVWELNSAIERGFERL